MAKLGFVMINDVRQPMKFGTLQIVGGPFEHMASVKRNFNRGSKEYVCFRDLSDGKVYLEEVVIHSDQLFQKIKDDKEWADLYRFLESHGTFQAYGAQKRLG
jgi:hypothetical protein